MGFAEISKRFYVAVPEIFFKTGWTELVYFQQSIRTAGSEAKIIKITVKELDNSYLVSI